MRVPSTGLAGAAVRGAACGIEYEELLTPGAAPQAWVRVLEGGSYITGAEMPALA